MDKSTKGSAKNYLAAKFFILIFLAFHADCFSQSLGINPTGSPPNASAGLDIDFPDAGLLIPRISLVSTASFAPLASHVAGMLVYNTVTTGDVMPGFYLDDGNRWMVPTLSGNATGDMEYWNGSAWITLPAGQPGQYLQINGSGMPAWAGFMLATLTTTDASSVTSSSAISGGTISNDGGTLITVFGVCWSTSPDPTTTLATKTIHISGGVGSFTSNITGLTTGTTYYARAYATNAAGTAYGNQVSFATP